MTGKYIDYVCDKLRFVVVVKRLRLTVSNEAALSAYHGRVFSVLVWSLTVGELGWNRTGPFQVQTKCEWAICGACIMDICKPLFKQLKILPLVWIYGRELCVFVRYPKYCKFWSNVADKSFRNKHRLHLPPRKLELYRRNAYINAIRVYNELPNIFKDLHLPMFKGKLTQWLLKKYFYDLNVYKWLSIFYWLLLRFKSVTSHIW